MRPKLQVDFRQSTETPCQDKKLLWPQLSTHWPLIEYRGIQDVFVIKYGLGQQEELRLHHDIAQVSTSIKPNSDYKGAELEFPRQNFTNRDIPLGHILVWPS